MQYPEVTANQGCGTGHIEVVQCSFRHCGYILCIWVQVIKVTLGSDSPNAVGHWGCSLLYPGNHLQQSTNLNHHLQVKYRLQVI